MLSTIWQVAFWVALVFGIWFMVQKKKGVLAEQPLLNPLTGKEKILVFILCVIDPIILGAIFYYGWKNKLPQQAKTANRLSWIAGVFFVIVFLAIIVTSSFSYARERGRRLTESVQQSDPIPSSNLNEAKIIAERPDPEDEAMIKLIKENIELGYNQAISWQPDAEWYNYRRVFTIPSDEPDKILTSVDSYYFRSRNIADNYEVMISRDSNNVARVNLNKDSLVGISFEERVSLEDIKIGPKKAFEIGMLSPKMQKFKDENKEFFSSVYIAKTTFLKSGNKYYWFVSLKVGSFINEVVMVDISTGEILEY